MSIRYSSVCDGIGAAHVAWQPLGWQCQWTSEIEPFPAAVVEQHHGFANIGDMTKITEEMLNERGPVDLLVGGTPCQSFSVAGLRGGLADPRGNLALRFVQLAAVMQPRWVVWENVPGVLSSSKGRDFGTFLRALGELGYGFAYRVLDAQWFGVAQRRRRVFVVGHLGDWRRAAAVLFERESVFGNPPTRGAKGEGITSSPQGIAGNVSSKWSKGTGGPAGDECYNLVAFQGGSQQDQVLTGDAVFPALCHSSNGNKGHHQPKVVVPYDIHGTLATKAASPTDVHTALRSRRPGESEASTTTVVAFAQNQREEVRELGDCATALNLQGTHQQTFLATPYTKSKRAQSVTDDETWVPGDISPTMSCFDQGETRATTVVALQDCGSRDKKQNGKGWNADGTAYTVDAAATQGVAAPVAQGFTYSGYSNQPAWLTGDRTDCLSASGHSDGSHQGIGVVNMGGDKGGASNSSDGSCFTLSTNEPHAVYLPMAVRRLTPRECERLQGFPDDYTLVTYRGKPAADGPRYRALGNSMAVPVMRWIGERIAAVDSLPLGS
jgi:DNA (cytosine-5)-methyltransferase 1